MAYAMAAMMAMKLVDGYFASESIKEQAKVNRQIAAMNAEFAELDAYDARIQGETTKAEYQVMIDKTLADQQLALAAADVDASYGTAAEVIKESKFIAELNVMEIEKRAEEQALGYKRQARSFRTNSLLDFSRSQSKAADVRAKSYTSAASSAISGYGDYASKKPKTTDPADDEFGEQYDTSIF